LSQAEELHDHFPRLFQLAFEIIKQFEVHDAQTQQFNSLSSSLTKHFH